MIDGATAGTKPACARKEQNMNEFDWGKTFGKFFISWIINDDFCGLAIRIGKEYADDVCCGVFHLTVQIGYGQFTIGIAEK